VEVGNHVQPGQVLFSIVPDTVYINANFKETQLTDVRPGQRVTIRVDVLPRSAPRGALRGGEAWRDHPLADKSW
jgi:membrane fusion protein, multidrug efflux system